MLYTVKKFVKSNIQVAVLLVLLCLANIFAPFAPLYAPWIPESILHAIPMRQVIIAVTILTHQVMFFFKVKKAMEEEKHTNTEQ